MLVRISFAAGDPAGRARESPSHAAAAAAAAATPQARRSRVLPPARADRGRHARLRALGDPAQLAASTSCAVWTRSSGSLARQLRTRRSSAGGVVG